MHATTKPASVGSSAVSLAIDLAKDVFELAFAPEHQRELERLLAALHSDAPQPPRERLTPPRENQEPPRDYAPKTPNAPGMLDEHYGLKK